MARVCVIEMLVQYATCATDFSDAMINDSETSILNRKAENHLFDRFRTGMHTQSSGVGLEGWWWWGWVGGGRGLVRLVDRDNKIEVKVRQVKKKKKSRPNPLLDLVVQSDYSSYRLFSGADQYNRVSYIMRSYLVLRLSLIAPIHYQTQSDDPISCYRELVYTIHDFADWSAPLVSRRHRSNRRTESETGVVLKGRGRTE